MLRANFDERYRRSIPTWFYEFRFMKPDLHCWQHCGLYIGMLRVLPVNGIVNDNKYMHVEKKQPAFSHFVNTRKWWRYEFERVRLLRIYCILYCKTLHWIVLVQESIFADVNLPRVIHLLIPDSAQFIRVTRHEPLPSRHHRLEKQKLC